MADTFVANGNTFNALSTFFAANAVVAGLYYALPPLGEPPTAGEPIYDESHVSFPGRDFVGIVRSGRSTRRIWADLVIINSLSASGAVRKTLLESLKQLARYTVTLPNGDSYDGCRLMAELGPPTVMNIASGYIAICYHSVCFESLSDSN